MTHEVEAIATRKQRESKDQKQTSNKTTFEIVQHTLTLHLRYQWTPCVPWMCCDTIWACISVGRLRDGR